MDLENKNFKKRKIHITIIRLAIVLSFFIIWELLARFEVYNSMFTSYPTEILKDLVEFYKSGDLIKHTSITLKEAFWGLFYGSFFGIILGLLLGQKKVLGQILVPIISAIHGIPQLTLAPVYILWFGLGLTSKIFLAALMVFFNVFFATFSGVNDIEPKLVEASTILGASKMETMFYVILPTTFPWILSGIRLGIGSSLVGAIIGEYIGASAGFGWMISYATSYFNITRVMSCIFILLIVGITLNFLLDKAEKYLLRWKDFKEII